MKDLGIGQEEGRGDVLVPGPVVEVSDEVSELGFSITFGQNDLVDVIMPDVRGKFG